MRIWTRQTQYAARLNLGSRFLRGLMVAYSAPQNDGVQGPIKIAQVGSRSLVYGKEGVGNSVDGTAGSNYLTTGSTRLPSGKWTIAAVMRCNSSWLGSEPAIGYAEAPNSGVYDRQIISSAGGFWAGYLYDGVSKVAATGRTIVANDWARLVITCNGSTLDAHVDGGSSGSVAVSNTGYTGYTTPEFLIGNSASIGRGTTVSLCLLLEDYWTAAEARAWIANPWQVFQPMPRRIFMPSVAAGGATTIDLTAAIFDWTANSVQPKDQKTLTTGTFTFSGKSIQNSLIARLGAATFTFTANAIAVGGQTIIDLTNATFTFTAQAIEKIQDTLIDLTSAVFTFSAKPITVTGLVSAVRKGGGMMMMLARRLSGRRYRDQIGKYE